MQFHCITQRHMFSELVKKELIEAGWMPGRKIDITQYENELIKNGYEVPRVLKNFLSEFGGLYLKYPLPPEILVDNPKIAPYAVTHFDVIKELGPYRGFPEKPEDIFEPRVGEDMIPFGAAYDNSIGLYMTPTGKIYGRDATFIVFLGNNYIEMLENAYHHKKPIEVPM